MEEIKVRKVFNTIEGDVEVGKGGVTKILYHEPLGNGDKHYVDVYTDFSKGTFLRLFIKDTDMIEIYR